MMQQVWIWNRLNEQVTCCAEGGANKYLNNFVKSKKMLIIIQQQILTFETSNSQSALLLLSTTDDAGYRWRNQTFAGGISISNYPILDLWDIHFESITLIFVFTGCDTPLPPDVQQHRLFIKIAHWVFR